MSIQKLLSFVPLLVISFACSSSPLTLAKDDAADAAAGAPNAGSAGQPSASDECAECMLDTCSATYQLCMPKDPNGCANLELCIERCSVASCTYECGSNWAVSPEASDYYACVSARCSSCFPGAERPAGGACQVCLLSCRGLQDCCAGDGCRCEDACEPEQD